MESFTLHLIFIFMNIFKSLGFTCALFLLISCADEHPQPVPIGENLIPDSFTEGDLTKTLVHDALGRLTQIQYLTTYPDGVEMTSVHNFSYDDQGQLRESDTDTGWRMEYVFSGGRIARTYEFVNGIKSDFHYFLYNADGSLAEIITFQDIPEEGGEIPVAKETYAYDGQGNLTLQKLYYYTSYGLEARLLSEFVFSDYDDMINSEEYFDVIGINPFIRLRKNNPGKMVVKNALGNVTSTETYRYEYHKKKYPVKKITDITFYDGRKGSYESTYRFRE